MHAISQTANNIDPESSYRLVSPSGSLDQVIKYLKLPSSFQDPDPTVKHPPTLRIPALLKDIFPRKPLLDSIGFPNAAYGSKESVANVTLTGYQAAPHIDLIEVVLVAGTTTKLWIFYKTPTSEVHTTIKPTKDIEGYTVEAMQNLITA
ncbi:hypothetical protein TWF481_002755 [Arthrobotrys musiformis]|uniref:Uncharacterized protein n=1 Tax=Arthrobotrys musiformis TaxID=47236 RepID=A0AAV9VSV6_9PEZI